MFKKKCTRTSAPLFFLSFSENYTSRVIQIVVKSFFRAKKKSQANLRPIRVVSLFGISNKKCITRQKLSLTSTLYAFTPLLFSRFLNHCCKSTVLRRIIVSYSLYLNLGNFITWTHVRVKNFSLFICSLGKKEHDIPKKKKKKKKTMFYSIVDNRKNKTLQSYAYDWERNGGAEQLAQAAIVSLLILRKRIRLRRCRYDYSNVVWKYKSIYMIHSKYISDAMLSDVS